MSRFANLLTWSWTDYIDESPFEIKVIAHNAEEARQEVFAILAEIARVKPLHMALEQAIKDTYRNRPAILTEEIAAQVENITAQLSAEQAQLVANIPADFFDGAYASSTFDYTEDHVMSRHDDMPGTLGEYIRDTEPECCGPVRIVSFRSCSD